MIYKFGARRLQNGRHCPDTTIESRRWKNFSAAIYIFQLSLWHSLPGFLRRGQASGTFTYWHQVTKATKYRSISIFEQNLFVNSRNLPQVSIIMARGDYITPLRLGVSTIKNYHPLRMAFAPLPSPGTVACLCPRRRCCGEKQSVKVQVRVEMLEE